MTSSFCVSGLRSKRSFGQPTLMPCAGACQLARWLLASFWVLLAPCGGARPFDEERRLLYVAMTRAKEHLFPIQPFRFFRTQQHHSSNGHMIARVRAFCQRHAEAFHSDNRPDADDRRRWVGASVGCQHRHWGATV